MALPIIAALILRARLAAIAQRILLQSQQVQKAIQQTVRSIKINHSQMDRAIRNLQKDFEVRAKQERFAISVALTRTARDAAQDVNAAMPTYLDRPTPFTMRAAAFRRASPTLLESWVYIQPTQAEYLKYQIYGGTRSPRRRAIVLPTDLPTNQYGNIPRGQIRALLRRPDVFSGTVRGIPGIWQRTAGGLLLLVSYAPRAKYGKRLPFERIVEKSRAKNFARHLEAARALAKLAAR